MLKPIGRIEGPERSIRKSSQHIPTDPNLSGGVGSADLGTSGSPPHELKCEHRIFCARDRGRGPRVTDDRLNVFRGLVFECDLHCTSAMVSVDPEIP
jgi:hypothetical protein